MSFTTLSSGIKKLSATPTGEAGIAVTDNAQITHNHIINTSNPHSVTAAQVGAAATSHAHATTDITSGTFADARIAATNVTQHQASLSITESQISDLTHGLFNVIEDATPQLGGGLDVLNNEIYSSTASLYFQVSSGGNVAIGTNLASYTLDVNGDIGCGNIYAQYNINGSGGTVTGGVLNTTDGYAYFGNGAFFVTEDFGVGTVSPGHKLEVNGTLGIGDGSVHVIPQLSGDSSATNSRLFLDPESGNQNFNFIARPSGTATQSSFQMRNVGGTNGAGRLQAGINGAAVSIAGNNYGVSGTTVTSMQLGLGAFGAVNDIVINSTGVGIGKTASVAKLDVEGDILSSGQISANSQLSGFSIYSATSISANGNIYTNSGNYTIFSNYLRTTSYNAYFPDSGPSFVSSLGIGSVSAGDYALEVEGQSIFSGSITCGGLSSSSVYSAGETSSSYLQLRERSSDPGSPNEGNAFIWMSNGVGTGDDGDIMISITAGAVTKTTTLVDFSALP